MTALLSTTTSPANFVELPIIILSPRMQSWATCTVSISRLLFPTFVVPFEAVPRDIVTFSLILFLLPISQVVDSPRYFRSCGFVEMLAPGNISFSLPIRAPLCIVTLFIRILLSPITTSLSIQQKGPIILLSPI